jgi:acyl transferase domain-containing protein
MHCRLGHAMTSAILHLTEVNLYVAGALRPGFDATLPRQPSGAPQLGHHACTGISGFAFQGTNAHVILGRCAHGAMLQ